MKSEQRKEPITIINILNGLMIIIVSFMGGTSKINLGVIYLSIIVTYILLDMKLDVQ